MNPDQTASFGGPDLAHCFQFMQQKRTIILIKNKMLNNEDRFFNALKLSDVVFILLIIDKMPTIAGILTFMGRIFNARLSCLKLLNYFIY